MARNENIAYPGSAWRPGLTQTPDTYKKRLQTSPNSVDVYWWSASADPTFNDKAGTFAANFTSGAARGQWQRTLQDGTQTVIIDGERLLRRYFQPGTWETGSIAICYDPDAFNLSEHDWIVQKGQGIQSYQIGLAAPSGAVIDARTYTQKEVVTRGAELVAGVGKVAISGQTVTGTGTAFSSFFSAGDVFKTSTGFAARIETVNSDTSLTLDDTPGPNLAGMAYSKGQDRLKYGPLAKLSFVQDASGTIYNPGVDVEIESLSQSVSPQQEGLIQWNAASLSPPIGMQYGVTYDYYTRYVVTDLGIKGAVVAGISLLNVVAGKLWKPDRSVV